MPSKWSRFLESSNQTPECISGLPHTYQMLSLYRLPGLRHTNNTGMRRITTFRSTADRIYDGGPIKLRGLSPRAKYTDRAAAAGRRS